MIHTRAFVALALVAAACHSKGMDELEAPRSFPIFQDGKFGFINVGGDIIVKPELEYWGPLPVSGGASPSIGPEESIIIGSLVAGTPSVGGIPYQTYYKPSRFWLLPGAEGAASITIRATSGDFSPSLALFEYRNGSWRQLKYSFNGSVVHRNTSSARYPLGVRLQTESYYRNSNPIAWAGGQFTISLERTGKRTTDLQFLTQLRFFEGRLPYRVSDRWGFLAADGTIAINPQFDSASAFNDGVAGVRINDRWGFVDREGTIVIQPTFDAVGSFSDGLVAAFVGRKCGYIDRDGRFAVNPSYARCSEFRSGVAVVRDDNRWGAVDREGKIVIAPQFEEMTHFYGDHAGVRIGGKWGLVDRTGKVTLTPQYDGIIAPTEGKLWVVGLGDRYGYIDVEGTFVFGPTLDSALAFDDGVARVRMDDQWGFIRPDGTYLGGAGPRYDEVRPMRNGRAAVRLGQSWGFIDPKGEIVGSPTYDAVGDFDGALAAVIQDGVLFYVDRAGKELRVSTSAAASTPTGSITGSLGYPSEYVPALYIIASEIGGTGRYHVLTQENDTTYRIDNVPAGQYHVVAYADWNIEISGGYTQYSLCGYGAHCVDHSLVPVSVTSGKVTEGIHPDDFYAGAGAFPAFPFRR